MTSGNIPTCCGLRTGKSLTVRFVEPSDAEALQAYFRSLSTRSRYNRFLGAISELPAAELDRFVHVGEADRFSVIAVMSIDGAETIVGEARYAFDADTDSFEFGLSIDDRWQGHGVGAALLRNLECRAAAFGANRLFGDTLALQRRHARPRPQVRLCLHQFARRLEAAAVRKAHRDRAAGNSLRQLAAGGGFRLAGRLIELTRFRSGTGFFRCDQAASSVQSVDVARSRQAASSRSTWACLLSIRCTVSLPNGNRVGGFLAFASCMNAFASLRGSPG